MNNYNSEWRIWAKIVAIVDMIFVVLLLLATLFMIFTAGLATEVAISDANKVAEVAGVVAWILWFVVAISVIQTGIGLWGTVQLLTATELGRELKDAYNRSERWQYASLALIVIIIILGIVEGLIILTIVFVLIRIIFMYIVYRFMQEVQVSFITTPHQMTQNF